jgi:hypothetical protein
MKPEKQLLGKIYYDNLKLEEYRSILNGIKNSSVESEQKIWINALKTFFIKNKLDINDISEYLLGKNKLMDILKIKNKKEEYERLRQIILEHRKNNNIEELLKCRKELYAFLEKNRVCDHEYDHETCRLLGKSNVLSIYRKMVPLRGNNS